MSSKYKLCTIYWINSKKKKQKKTTRSMAVELVHWHTCICKFFNKICAVQIFTQILWFWKKKKLIYIKKFQNIYTVSNINSSIKFLFLFFSDTICLLILKYHFKPKKKIQKNISVCNVNDHNKFVNIFAIYQQ